MSTPKRYRFDNQLPVHQPVPVPPVQRLDAGTAPVEQQPAQQIVVQHIHQAPPDRTLQRAAFGTGIGAGAVVTAVYFGPLLIASLTTMAIIVLAGALAIAVLAVAIVHVTGALRPAQGRKRRG